MPIILETSNEELHQTLTQRAKDRQREEYIAVLHTRQYPLPVVLLKIVISYLPGYFMHWLPSGELIFKQEMSLAPKPMWNYVKPQSLQIKYDDADDNDDNDSYYDDYDNDEYADYENKYNPESDDY